MPAPSTTHHSPLTADQLVLGIDGGGTRTVALLARRSGPHTVEDCEIVARGVAGPSNHLAVGQDRALAALDDAVNQAFGAASVARGSVLAACLGLAGADRPADREMLSRWAASVSLSDRVRIENDGRLVLAAGTPDDWGLAVIAGTGSFALARAPDGRAARAGGWGYLLGDDCGAYSIALAGLRAVARAADASGPTTAMTDRLLQRLGIANAAELIPKIYGGGLDRAAIASLADVVTSADAAGDVAAHKILSNEAEHLAAAARAASRILTASSSDPVPLALAGSVLTSCPSVADRLVSGLRHRGVNLGTVQLVNEPAHGAIRLARATVK
jgi:N-acetylglucosamine kinase-like BadF-type ATPase